MMRRAILRLSPLALVLAALALRSAGCKKAAPPVPGAAPPERWSTPLLTAPPPRPTPTLWRTDITRIPTLPE
jgi:hypothetical protein